jgi:hypothetical protein
MEAPEGLEVRPGEPNAAAGDTCRASREEQVQDFIYS